MSERIVCELSTETTDYCTAHRRFFEEKHLCPIGEIIYKAEKAEKRVNELESLVGKTISGERIVFVDKPKEPYMCINCVRVEHSLAAHKEAIRKKEDILNKAIMYTNIERKSATRLALIRDTIRQALAIKLEENK